MPGSHDWASSLVTHGARESDYPTGPDPKKAITAPQVSIRNGGILADSFSRSLLRVGRFVRRFPLAPSRAELPFPVPEPTWETRTTGSRASDGRTGHSFRTPALGPPATAL